MKHFGHVGRRSTWWRAAVGASAAALLLAAGGSALSQPAQRRTPKLPVSLVIYRGDSLQTSGISLGAWGSGSVETDTSKVFNGTESIKLVTHGLYQGGAINLTRPVNLGPYLGNKANYLTVALYVPPPINNPGGPGGGGIGSPSVGGSPGLSGYPGYGGGSSGGPYGGGKGPGLGGGGQIQTQKNRKLENLRIVMVSTGGKTIEAMLPLENATEEEGWKILSIPVALIPNLTADDAQIQSLRLFGDAPTTLNVGSIGVVEDNSPIQLEPINDKTVQRLARYQYLATASAGVTPLVFSWDWNAADGIQDETRGHNVTHVFRRASVDDQGRTTDFVVTVTVSDLYGIKAPAKTSFKVHVTP
ncbi:MAG TPA: hypothetical protein VKT77_04505 [Chthonomonadaceae bacterium]|nr:hypothetical protein [Chthonomonadaceae bacterium]